MSILKRIFKSTETEGPGCRKCGICCELYGDSIKASDSDLMRWERENRSDIASYAGHGGELWIDPETGRKMDRCPFLVKADGRDSICQINETKPLMCRVYPTRAHMERCVMGVVFTPGDEDGRESLYC